MLDKEVFEGDLIAGRYTYAVEFGRDECDLGLDKSIIHSIK